MVYSCPNSFIQTNSFINTVVRESGDMGLVQKDGTEVEDQLQSYWMVDEAQLLNGQFLFQLLASQRREIAWIINT